MRIREELGLAYYVGAQSQPGLTPGFFAFYAGTSPESVEQVEKELLEESGKLRDGGFEFGFTPIKIKFSPNAEIVKTIEETGAKFGRKSCVWTFTDKKLLILHEFH